MFCIHNEQILLSAKDMNGIGYTFHNTFYGNSTRGNLESLETSVDLISPKLPTGTTFNMVAYVLICFIIKVVTVLDSSSHLWEKLNTTSKHSL